MKSFKLLAVSVLLVLSLTTCALAVPANEANLVLSTGSTISTYFQFGGAMANIFSTYIPDLNVTAQTSGASVANLKLLDRGECELGLAQSDVGHYAFNGEQMFTGPYEKIRAIASLFPEVIQVCVKTDKDINTLSDLKGKRISVGAPGSGAEANSRQFLPILGIPYDSFDAHFLATTDAASQYKDNNIDGFIVTAAIPTPAIQEIATTKEAKILSFTEEEVNKICETFPFLAPYSIPAKTYQSQTEPVRSITVQAALFTNIDISEDTIYLITKTLWEKQSDLASINQKAGAMDIKNPVSGITVPVHPGALKYYKEIGVMK